MLGRVFELGRIQRLEARWVVNSTSLRGLTWRGHACSTVKNATHPRRIKQFAEDQHHYVVNSLGCTGYMTKSFSSHSGRLEEFTEATPMHRVLIAFGSNVGDRIGHIEKAFVEMEKRSLKIKSVSGLYETEPMYVSNQDVFLNGTCEVETDLDPLPLLDVLQKIENDLGRQRIIDKGPRNIDLDILLYDYQQVSHERLQIPHKMMHEREFVLRPLADLLPEKCRPPFPGPQTIQLHLMHAEEKAPGKRPYRVTATSPCLPLLKSANPTRSTHIMAILNLTPDSFSDGNIHFSNNMEALEKTIQGFIKSGATIVDVGGQSTRPNAEKVSPEQELQRILPAIKRMRSMPEAKNIAISVDTFYAHVAEEAVAAGVDIINDITAGEGDPTMLATAARLQRTIVLMHMRGTPQTMTDLTEYQGDIIHGVGRELSKRVEAAKAAGILPWRIILDPGIGFAKTQDQNLELLRRLDELRAYKGLEGFPWLVGTSRKGFIGKITGVKKAHGRSWGTAAAVTASIRGGADIVRVHDVAGMTQVAKMADAIFRVEQKRETGQSPSSRTFQDSILGKGG